MARIHYIIGDATKPLVKDGEFSLIVHCCNTLGAWGAGFVIPLGKRYPKAKESYLNYIRNNYPKLGQVDEVKVSDNIYVENLMGQSFLGCGENGEIPCSYTAIEEGFLNIIHNSECSKENEKFTIHMPRIGCGLAGGDWSVIEKIINKTFCKDGIDVFVYDLREDGKTNYE